MQRVFIDLGSDPPAARKSATDGSVPALEAVLGAPLTIVFNFGDFGDEEAAALADDTVATLTIKAPGDRAGAAVFLDASVVRAGLDYQFTGVLNATALVTALGELEFIEATASLTFTEPGEPLRKAKDFPITIHNSSSRPEDVIPAGSSIGDDYLVLPDGGKIAILRD